MKITLTMRDTSTGETGRIRFSSWTEASNHIRMVILGQIVGELYEIALNDKPEQFRKDIEEQIEELKEIADLANHPRDEKELEYALSAWSDYVDEAPMHTVIEIKR